MKILFKLTVDLWNDKDKQIKFADVIASGTIVTQCPNNESMVVNISDCLVAKMSYNVLSKHKLTLVKFDKPIEVEFRTDDGYKGMEYDGVVLKERFLKLLQ